MKKVIRLFVIPLFLLSLIGTLRASGQTDNAAQEVVQCVYHKVEKGETIYGIAKKYNADVNQIFKLNPGSKDVLWAGATLLIPSAGINISGNIASDTLHIKDHIEEFIGEASSIANCPMNDFDDIDQATKKLNTINTKWNVYYQAKQANIADNDSLMEIATQFQQIAQEMKDTLASSKNRLLLIENFNKAEKFIANQVGIYQQLAKQAKELSLAPGLASKLEALKAKEQLVSADIEKNYEAAKTAAAQNSSLKKRMNQISNNYITIKGYSDEIKEAKYKPLFARIKDYLFGLAAVTIIMMFLNMAHSKIQAIKQARAAAKKLEKYRQQNDDEYPTI